MKPADFIYHRPERLDEALRLLAEYDGGARILSGGQSLMPMMNMRLVRPLALIDVNAIPDIAGVELRADGTAELGARVRYATIETSGEIARRLPLLKHVVGHVGDRQVRNRGTIGGSLAQADPAGNVPLAALALGARVVARSLRGEREIGIEDFFAGPYATALADDEMLVAVRFPTHPAAFAFTEIARRHNDFAVLSVAVAGNRDVHGIWSGLRIAIGGMHGTPVLAREAMAIGEAGDLSDAAIDAVATAALEPCAPASDMRASAEYRRHLLPIHVARTLRRMRDDAPRSGSKVSGRAA